ncbi:hypothetical protein CLV30_112129 [Haloactinopolyspora alba]|uniref:DUF2332 domain-containing protein n=1 Tax=Haloactinopolyspora alba TaxID=648780 RepID=A0A2P8DXD9_9ACTN|nr:DUF2332 domain-containing protein [Haloactinopolyspora alba]PSL01889.1 hypothetical protein CLV30_112129 [Haloactinopolyspora alba]
MTLAERFRSHADACDRMGAPLYGVLMRGMAGDWEAGGVVRDICAGWEDATDADVVQLRFLAGVHRLVLTGRAPALEPYYRNLGGERAPDYAWETAVDVVVRHRDELRHDLEIVPQTNEVGRTVPLVVALYAAAAATGRRRVRLLEVGASAGLNLLPDEYRIDTGSWSWGPPDADVRIDATVEVPVTPVPVEIVARRGCDRDPVDPRSDEGRLRLRSFVWPDDVERYRRLDGALAVAARHPEVAVDRAGAATWLRAQLAEPVGDDVLTVVWHSVVWQYLSQQERREADAVIDAAAARMPLAHVSMEPVDPHRVSDIALTLTTRADDAERPDAAVERLDADRAERTVTLGAVHPHGTPLRPAPPRE